MRFLELSASLGRVVMWVKGSGSQITQVWLRLMQETGGLVEVKILLEVSLVFLARFFNELDLGGKIVSTVYGAVFLGASNVVAVLQHRL